MKSLEGKAFGELLGQFRMDAKLSQKRLADLMGKSRGTIINWENGTHLPKERALVLGLAKHLQLDSLKKDQLLEAALFEPSGTIWTIPFQRNPFFTGREEILSQLRNTLDTNNTVALMQPQALKGLGGIGKTHTAIEYAYRYRDEYQTILWAPAATSSTLQASLMSIAKALNLPQKNERDQTVIIQAVKNWLMNHIGWLLILDNVEDLRDVGMLYPWAHSGHVLITTRSQSVGGIALSVAVEKMEPEEGALFLLRRAALIGPHETVEQAQGKDYEKARHLSEILGGLPLALDQAAAYIEKTKCGLSTYLTLYNTQRTQLLKERGSLTTDHPESVTITFSLAFQKIKDMNRACGEIIQFCAFLSPDAIPEEILTQGGASLGPTLEPITTDLVALNTAIGVLLAYSLVQRNIDRTTETHTLSIHRLVQAVLQDGMERAEKQCWAERVVLAVNLNFPPIEHATWQQCERLLPHVLVVTEYIKPYQLMSLEAGSLLDRVARYLVERARFQEAEPRFQQALEIRKLLLGPEHPDIATSLNGLAILYKEQGKYTEAEALHQRALHMRELLLGPEHLDVATSLNGLAILCQRQGKHAEAELLYQRALAIRERVLGYEHLDTTSILNNLASVYVNQGRYVEAEFLHKRALATRKQKLGDAHPDTANSLNNLAGLYVDWGKYEEAEPLHQQALRLWEQLLGINHPLVAISLSNLAQLYVDWGKYEEAEPLYQRAIRIRERYGSEHPDLAYPLNNLAELYLIQKRYEEAEPLYRRALLLWERSELAAHPLNGLADLYGLQGKYEEAELLYRRALFIQERALEPNHPHIADTAHRFAVFQTLRGNHSEAVSLSRHALVIREQVYGPQHPKTTETREHLYATLIVLGRSEEAEQLNSVQSDARAAEGEQEAGQE